MRYEKAKKLMEIEFKRLCGEGHETFLEMCGIVRAVEEQKTSGRKSHLSVANARLADTYVLAGISDNVSSGARLGLTRTEMSGDWSDASKIF